MDASTSMKSNKTFSFSIDRGGTFTDVYCEIHEDDGTTSTKVMKLLSVDPENYPDAPREGIRRFLESELGIPHPREGKLCTSQIKSIRMGTTVATNALLERQGERTALLTTKGFRDLLHIANQSRPNIFDLEVRMPENLYEEVVEVDEEVGLPLRNGNANRSGGVADDWYDAEEVVDGDNKEAIAVRRRVDVVALRQDLERLKRQGIKSLAVVLKHAALFPDHEILVGSIAKEIGFEQVSLSHAVMPMVKMVPRGFTATADAYLTPHILKYIQTFSEGFDSGLKNTPLYFMQSDGGLTDVGSFSGHRAVLSGPAGGYVGYALTTPAFDFSQTIGFDMGGTSTDVSRYSTSFAHVFESTTAGITIQAPQLDINTVAAGGGSRLFYESGVFRVGPESAGSHPGPVCYRKNGHLAITDANVVLGRVMPEYFPRIFGKNEDEMLDRDAAVAAMSEVQKQLNLETGGNKTVEDVAMGFVKVANEAMCRPIRALTQMRGFDVSRHTLACFGGAGGQHACAIARNLGMEKIYVHKYSGVLSAVGIGLADVCVERQHPVSLDVLDDEVDVKAQLDDLETLVKADLEDKGFEGPRIELQRYLNLRYDGTDVAIMTECTPSIVEEFLSNYKREFGFVLEGRKILVDDLRVRGVGKVGGDAGDHEGKNVTFSSPPPPSTTTQAYFEPKGMQSTSVYILQELSGTVVKGPSIIIDDISTIVVEPGCTAEIDTSNNVTITVDGISSVNVNASYQDPVQLAVFSHRFMGIAEQMGRVLQRTSISVNIKERLDFSCALFDKEGNLVSNAPHLPVHLGAMSEAVKYQIRHAQQHGPLRQGDVVVSNHPQLAGGSHLPDITAITPVFDEDSGEIIFFVASRGHHADVGGISPGSMPPNSLSLADEGIAIISFKVVNGGVFDDAGLRSILASSRNIEDNVSDLRAQIAANNCGINLVQDLIKEYSLPVVQAYMRYIQENADLAVRDMLKEFAALSGGRVWAEDRMDDGTSICLTVSIDSNHGSAVFDFTGTGPQVFGNTNAPPAVVHSAIIYSLRAMLDKDIPLNHGCMKAISIVIPPNCLLDPSPDAAVVGGNVLTSQRVTDVILSAFHAAAPSQGCMNNLTFGDEAMGYYETIAGGAGAGPGWHGRSGVHTHMTNTRITDPEILERRYPVSVKSFLLREGSGGIGKWHGGDGVVREIEFLRPLTVSILSERRCMDVPGILGGGDGKRGRNLWVKREGQVVSLGGKATVKMDAGDRLRIETPGGAGYGEPKSSTDVNEEKRQRASEMVEWMYQRRLNRGDGSSDSHSSRTRGSVSDYTRLQETA
jgi:5-oxoprolinase (ATP-hydrolysing)